MNIRAFRISTTSYFLFLLFNSFHGQSQAGSDYLVQVNGDTLYGQIELLRPSLGAEMVSVEIQKNQLKLNANRINRLLVDGTFYQSILRKGKYQIMKEIESGYLSLYQFRLENGFDFQGHFLFKSTGEGLEVPTLLFKNTVADYLAECPFVHERIKKKKYSIRTLLELVQDYNSKCLDDVEAVEKDSESKVLSEREQRIIEIIQLLNSGEYPNELLIDISYKIRKGEIIPFYMLSALENDENGYDEKLVKELTSLLKGN